MIEYLWGEQLNGPQLREAATGLFHQADNLTWESLVAPFVRYEPLVDSKAHVETVVMRQPACSALPALTRTHAAAGGAARLPGHRT